MKTSERRALAQKLNEDLKDLIDRKRKEIVLDEREYVKVNSRFIGESYMLKEDVAAYVFKRLLLDAEVKDLLIKLNILS